MTDNSREGWIEWSGGPNPVPGQMVQTKDHHGVALARLSDTIPYTDWTGQTGQFSIIAYRVVTDASVSPAGYVGAAEVSPNSPDELAMAIERERALLEGLASRLERQSGGLAQNSMSEAMAFLMREEAKAIRLIPSRLASQEETIRADGGIMRRVYEQLWALPVRSDVTISRAILSDRMEARARLSARQEGRAQGSGGSGE